MSSILKKKPFKRLREDTVVDADKYIDLGELVFEDEMLEEASTTVKIAELHRYEDLNDLTKLVYGGHPLILDFTSIANDQLALKRVTNELKAVARDISGDVVGIGRNLLFVTPTGMRVDRNKIKGPF